ncbi:MAG: sigma-70 family RNA polymerase sigma factor [Bacteroidales bacterium]|nr:sigma-70 family RNA polymerase sigma factor [Bacteroidales bacterium]MBN2697564.1 sigma-70 family RNA polymerase sigma factor [Bacteroidales bacterium]
MSHRSGKDIVNALRSRDPVLARRLLQDNFNSMKWLIWNREVTGLNTYELFSDIMTIIYRKADQPGFRLECNINTYFMKIADKYLRFYRSRTNSETVPEMTGLWEAEEIPAPRPYEELFDLKHALQLVRRVLLSMQTACKRILNLFFQGYSNGAIAERMKRSETAVRTLKKKCRKQFIDRIQNDPDYMELLRMDVVLNKTEER